MVTAVSMSAVCAPALLTAVKLKEENCLQKKVDRKAQD